jgi:hypothetical protein
MGRWDGVKQKSRQVSCYYKFGVFGHMANSVLLISIAFTSQRRNWRKQETICKFHGVHEGPDFRNVPAKKHQNTEVELIHSI